MSDPPINDPAPVLDYRNSSAHASAAPWWLEPATTAVAWVVVIGGVALLVVRLVPFLTGATY